MVNRTLDQLQRDIDSSLPGSMLTVTTEEYSRWCIHGGRLTEGRRFRINHDNEVLILKEKEMSPLAVQIGGDHYKSLAIQPVAYIHANKIPFIEGSIIKYVTRWRNKGGLKDLEKAKHFIDLLIQLEQNSSEPSSTSL